MSILQESKYIAVNLKSSCIIEFVVLRVRCESSFKSVSEFIDPCTRLAPQEKCAVGTNSSTLDPVID